MSTRAGIDEEAGPTFWHNATRYTRSVDNDGPFVEELAYVMVTLHRTGA